MEASFPRVDDPPGQERVSGHAPAGQPVNPVENRAIQPGARRGRRGRRRRRRVRARAS